MSRIRSKLNRAGLVNLHIVNLMGMKLDELPAGYLEAGEHSVLWKPKFNLSGSVLNYRIELNKRVVSENLFIVR